MTKDITANDERIVNNFIPTPSMEKWLDTQVELKTDSPGEISKHSLLTKQAWYKWLKQPGFEDWYYAEYDKKIRRYRPRLDAIGMKQSEKGSYNHWKDMQRFAGRSDEAGTTVNLNQLIVIK